MNDHHVNQAVQGTLRENIKALHQQFHPSEAYLKSYGYREYDLKMFENGERVPSLAELAEIAEMFHTDPFVLLIEGSCHACNA